MKALVVIANPSAASFTHAMAEAASEVLRAKAYEVLSHDLYAEGFNPVQAHGEAANTTSDDALVEQHCAELVASELILVFHPNWWSQPPAILKGWIDRVFRLDTAYGYPAGVGFEGLPVGLLKARHALVFNTSNTPVEREQLVFGDPLETLWKTSVFGLCGVQGFGRRMYAPVAASTPEQRQRWLADVQATVNQVA
jgi:NAD(P)H dehydrogenase (quinone)